MAAIKLSAWEIAEVMGLCFDGFIGDSSGIDFSYEFSLDNRNYMNIKYNPYECTTIDEAKEQAAEIFFSDIRSVVMRGVV